MKNPILNLSTILLLILSFAAIAFACIEVFFFENSVMSLKEGGILELMQVLVLAATVVMYLLAVVKNKADERFISLCFATIFYIFILRELDIKNADVPEYIKYIFHGTGRTITAVALIAVSLTGAALNYKHYVVKTVSLLFSKRGALLWAAFAFLQIGQWLEKTDLSYNVLLEESFEMVGYCLLLICAYKTLKIPRFTNSYKA